MTIFTSDIGSVPVISGLAVGIAFVVTFALIIGSLPVVPNANARLDDTGLDTPPTGTGFPSNQLQVTIGGMKSSYALGEQIVLSVHANGTSDNACNIGSPKVVMHDDSNGNIILWPEPFPLTHAILCPQFHIDKTWTYGDEADEQMSMDKAGSFTIIASVDDITVEKQFDVIS